MIEAVRQCTFTTEAYQQVQVDCQLLRQMMPYFLQDSSVPESMADEVMVSAAERCVQPEGMESSDVLSLIYTAQAKLSLKTSKGAPVDEW